MSCLCAWFCISAACSADGALEKNVRFAFQGMDDSRMRLVSGICHITGRTTGVRVYDGETDSFKEETKENITIIFDYQKGFYRFENRACRSLKTPEYYYELWYPGRPDEAADRYPISQFKPSYLSRLFDIRLLGFFSLLGYSQDTYSVFRRSIFEETPISYERSSNGLIQITTNRKPLVPGPVLVRHFWLSPDQGYSLIKLECEGIASMEMSWEKRNDTWVPTACKITPFLEQDDGFADWTIAWESVNEPIPEHYFDPHSLATKPAVSLYSSELGAGFGRVKIGTLGGGEPIYDLSPTKTPSYSFNRILLGLGILLIFLGLGKMVRERWKNYVS